MLTAEEIGVALSGGYELNRLEVKGPGMRTDSHLFAKVTRAALGLGNMRDGGHIVIGLDSDKLAELEPGLSPAELASWLSYDDVARKLAEYADPALRFDVAERTLSSGAKIAVIQVMEFADQPHICSRAYDSVLRKGAVYIRPRKVPETSEVADSFEMRELLDLATEKALRRYIETSRRAGLLLGSAAPSPSAGELFEAERKGAWQ